MTAPVGFSGWLSAARQNRLVRSGAGVGGLTGAEMALGLAAAILLARALGAEGLGIYSLTLAAVVIGSLPVEFGLPILVMREIAHHAAGGETGQKPSAAPDAVKGVLIFSVTVILLMSAAIILLALTLGETLAPALDRAGPSMIVVAVGLIPLSALGKTFGAALAGRQMVVLGMIPQRLVRPAAFAIALAAATVLAPGWLTPVRAMGLQLASAAVALVVGGYHFRRHFADVLNRQPAVIEWRGWSAAMFRLGIANGIRLSQGQVLLLVVGALSSAENAGLLRIAQRGGGLAATGAVIAIGAVSPHVARLNAEGQRDRLQHLLTQTARAGSAVALVVLICFALGGHWLLGALFGSEFTTAWSALVILASAETARTLLGPGAMLMNMVRHESVTALAFMISLGVSVAIAVALAPAFGAAGAAWGMFVGVTGGSAFLWQKARRSLKLDPAAFARPIGSSEHEGQA